MSYNGPLPQVVNAGGTGRATLTNHGVLVGATASAITQISPSSTTGAVFIGAGSSADPAYSTTTTITDTTGLLTITAANGGGINVNQANSATAATVQVANSSNTANSGANFVAAVNGTSSGDPFNQWTVGSSATYCLGIDTPTSGQPLKLTYAAASSGTPSAGTVIMNATSAGAVTKPNQPAFMAFLSSPQSSVTGDGTMYTIVFDSTNFSQGGAYNTGTGTVTIPVGGRYWIYAQCLWTSLGAAHTSGNIQITSLSGTYSTSVILHGGELNPATCRQLSVNTNDLIVTVQGFVQFAANDTFNCQTAVSSSTKTVGVFGNASPGFYTHLSAYLVC